LSSLRLGDARGGVPPEAVRLAGDAMVHGCSPSAGAMPVERGERAGSRAGRWGARPSGKADHRVTIPVRPRIIPEEAKRRLRIMFVAKHALWDGGLHPDDGNHALYHVETREILKSLGFDLVVESRYSALFEEQDVDFLFRMYNRGG
jgi:hypothetical protein